MDTTEKDHYALRMLPVLFYADDGFIALQSPRVLQEALDALVWLFEKLGLLTSTKNTRAIISLLGKIRTRLSKA